MSHKGSTNHKNYEKYKRRSSEEREDSRHRSRKDDKKYDRDYQKHKRRSSEERGEDRRRFKEDKNYNWGGKVEKESTKLPTEKEQPNFQVTGRLAQDVNTYRGVVIKYSEPEDARIPKRRWRLYPFKGDKPLPVFYIHRQSGYLIGRERKIADIAVDHPSCSKQHAAFQFRLVPFKTESGLEIKRIRPYIMDLGSSNGTFLNNQRIEPRRFYELFERDVLKFGYSTREYVLLHEDSADAADDDVIEN